MDHFRNENQKLGEEIKLLQRRASLYKRLFEMSLGVIESFSHFIPDVVAKYKAEIEIESAKADID